MSRLDYYKQINWMGWRDRFGEMAKTCGWAGEKSDQQVFVPIEPRIARACIETSIRLSQPVLVHAHAHSRKKSEQPSRHRRLILEILNSGILIFRQQNCSRTVARTPSEIKEKTPLVAGEKQLK